MRRYKMSYSNNIVTLGWQGLLLLAFAGCATLDKSKPTEMVWPDPPEKPRIKFVRSLRSQEDLSGPSVVEILTGGDERKKGLYQPMGMAISDDNHRLYVADFAWSHIFVFDFENKTTRYIGTQERFPLGRPLGVALDGDENVYVTDLATRSVRVYNKNGRFLRGIGEGVLEKPTGLAVDRKRNRLHVVDTGRNDRKEKKAHQIVVFDLNGKLIRKIGKRGDKDGEFNFPTYASLDSSGRLYVVDSINFRIQVFDPNGKFLYKFGRPGDRPGDFARPKGVALDTFGNVYVVDSIWSNIQIFNKKSELLMFFAGYGSSPGLLVNPATIAIGRDNKIYVSDSYGRRINIYQLINTTSKDSFLSLPTNVEKKGGETNVKGGKGNQLYNKSGKEVTKK
jgi:DNA-binding beta-propeller fold protein YncE